MQHIYTSPKKRFFPHKTNAILVQKGAASTIRTCTFQCNQNMICNLSNHTLTGEELSALTEALLFFPTSTKTFNHEITKSWFNFKRHMLKQFFSSTAFTKNTILFRVILCGCFIPQTTTLWIAYSYVFNTNQTLWIIHAEKATIT